MMPAVMAVFRAATTPTPGDGPSAAPSSPSDESYSTPAKIRALWTNGDVTAYTEVWYNTSTNSFADGGTTLEGTAGPGDVSLNTTLDYSGTTFMWVRHKKNGQFSTEVAFTAGSGEA